MARVTTIQPGKPRMKAIVYERYGPPEVLHVKDVAKPTPKDNEILIRNFATTVTAADRRVRSFDVPFGFWLMSRLFLGIFRPRRQILGTELAGAVESIGKNVSKFKVGDQVFASSGARMGCYVEYKCMPEDGTVALKPSNVTFDEAAALSFGGTAALHFLRKGKLQPGERVLINGASGGVGTAAVQLAKHFGAVVTGVCSTANVELVRSLGADHVIDYTKEDFTKNGETYDVIVDTVGTAPFSRAKRSLADRGRLLLVLATLPDLLTAPWLSMTTKKKVIAGQASERPEDLRLLAELAEAGELRSVIDRRYPFAQIAEAHRYVDTGRKRGAVVITVEHAD